MATLRKLRKTMLIPWMTLVTGLSVIGGVDGQSIIKHPKDFTGTVGGTADFTCQVDFDGIRNIMEWKYYDSPVYVYQHGADDFPEGQEKYSVAKDESDTFTLTVKNLGHQDAGIYTCDAYGAAAKAVLMVLAIPTAITPKPDPEESETVQYLCTAKFSGPSRDEIPPEQYPKLQMFFGGKLQDGRVVEKGDFDKSRTHYEITQVLNVTLEASMHGKNLTCDIRSSSLMKNVSYTTQVMVLYAVRTITYTPNNDQYVVGDDISCIADGSPRPDFIWDDIKNAGKFTEGPSLKITEEMMGSNTWRCTARNTIGGRSHQKNIVADFSVVLETEQEHAIDDSWKIAVAITIPICIIIGSLVAVFLYCRVYRNQSPEHLDPDGKAKESLLGYTGNDFALRKPLAPGSVWHSLSIICGQDGKKWEKEIRDICIAYEESSQSGDVDVKRYVVQTYGSLDKLEAKFKHSKDSAGKLINEKLIIILSKGFKDHASKYVESLTSYPVWFSRTTVIVDLPAAEIPGWLDKRGVDYINAGQYDDIGRKIKISESLFGNASALLRRTVSVKTRNEDIAYQADKFEVGSVAEGLAWSYFLNYINFIGLTMGERIEKFENTVGIAKGSIPKKMFILLPSSCYSHPKLQDADPAITHAGKLETITQQIAGNTRNYETVMHQITASGQTYYACVEYCTPALVLYEMSVKGVAGLSPLETKAQLHVFKQLLQTILEHPYFPQFCQNIKLVAYDDGGEKSLSETLVEHINACLGKL